MAGTRLLPADYRAQVTEEYDDDECIEAPIEVDDEDGSRGDDNEAARAVVSRDTVDLIEYEAWKRIGVRQANGDINTNTIL